MKKSNSIIGLISLYSGLIVFCFLCNQFLFGNLFNSNGASLINAIAQASLVEMQFGSGEKPMLFTVYSLIGTQLAGILWLSILLWFYWKLFDRKFRHSWKDAIVLTVKVSLFFEGVLFIFFIYSLPSSASDTMSQKLLTALALSAGSFNGAGIAQLGLSISREVLQANFLVQMGIILGSGLGGLGIFVINELLAPANLRYRLTNPETDWSLITKTVVFGTSVLISICSLLFFFSTPQSLPASKKLIEVIAGIIFEVNAARGFGHYIIEDYNFNSSLILLTSSVFGSSPFSTGGGLTLLFFTGIVYLFREKRNAKAMDWAVAFTVVKHLLIYTTITFSALFMIRYFLNPNHSLFQLSYEQWMMYCSNSIANGNTDVIDMITIILGRMSFAVACYLTMRHNSK